MPVFSCCTQPHLSGSTLNRLPEIISGCQLVLAFLQVQPSLVLSPKSALTSGRALLQLPTALCRSGLDGRSSTLVADTCVWVWYILQRMPVSWSSCLCPLAQLVTWVDHAWNPSSQAGLLATCM